MPLLRGRVALALRSRTRIAIDALLAVLLVATVSTALVEEIPHEWLGLATVVLALVHGVAAAPRLARRVGRGGSGHTRVRDCVGVALAVLACAGFLAQLVSALVLSKYAFSWLPAFDGAQSARAVHLACCYWTFAMAFLHAGYQLGPLAAHAISQRRWLAAVLAIACLAGIASFVQLGLGPYLLLQIAFAAPDLTRPLALTVLEFCLTGLLFTAIGGALSRVLR